MITEEELLVQPSGSAYDAVNRLRPGWLRSRGRTIGEESVPRVFVDGRDFGTLESLHGLNIQNISEMRYVSSRDATTRFGTGYPGGIIEVRLKSQEPPVP